jgi:MSHA biogenesis protein MshQ
MSNPTNGYDLRFTDSTGTTLLPFEIESLTSVTTSTTASIWVRVPTVTTASSTDIYIYYGNPTAASTNWTAATSAITNCTSITNAQCVWKENASQNFAAVYHLKETGTGAAGDYKDSTSKDNDSTNTANQPTATSLGKINGAESFNGSSGYIDASSTSVPTGASARTVSIWFNATSISADDYNAVFSYGATSGGSDNIYEVMIGQTNNLYFHTNAYYPAVQEISTGTWYYVDYVYDGTNMIAYVNGVSKLDVSHALNTTSSNLKFSKSILTSYPRYFDGIADEARVSSTARSAAWVEFEYCNMTNSDASTCGADNNYELSFGSQVSNSSPTYSGLRFQNGALRFRNGALRIKAP